MSFIFLYKASPILGVPPVSITRMDLSPTINPIFDMSPLLILLASS